MARTQSLRRKHHGQPLKAHDPGVSPLGPRFEEYLHAKRWSIDEATREIGS